MIQHITPEDITKQLEADADPGEPEEQGQQEPEELTPMDVWADMMAQKAAWAPNMPNQVFLSKKTMLEAIMPAMAVQVGKIVSDLPVPVLIEGMRVKYCQTLAFPTVSVCLDGKELPIEEPADQDDSEGAGAE